MSKERRGGAVTTRNPSLHNDALDLSAILSMVELCEELVAGILSAHPEEAREELTQIARTIKKLKTALARQLKYLVPCEHCGKLYQRWRADHRFCSSACRNAQWCAENRRAGQRKSVDKR